jgi:hypothetical protein
MPFPSFLILLATPLWICWIQAFVHRIPGAKRIPRQKLAVFCCLAGVVGVCLFVRFPEGGTFGARLGNWVFALLSALGLSHVYFHLFNMSETARRIRIVTGLKQDGRLEATESAGYSNLVGVRLERLVILNQITRQGDKFVAHPSLLGCVAAIFKTYEHLLFPERVTEKAPETAPARSLSR